MKKLLCLLSAILTYGTSVWGQAYGVCLSQDDGNLYISVPEFESFVVMDKSTGTMDFYHAKNSALDLSAGPFLVNGIAGSNGEAWITYGGSFRAHYADGVFETYGSINGNYMFSNLTRDLEGNLWAISRGVSAYKLDSDLALSGVYTLESTYADMSIIKSLAVGQDGSIWFFGIIYDDVEGGQQRSPLFKLTDGKFQFYPATRASGISAIAVDAFGNVWCARDKYNDLVVFDGSTLEKKMDLPEELKGHLFEDMKFDEQGRLWILSRAGFISCVENGVCRVYTVPAMSYHTSMVSLSVCGEDVYAIGYAFVNNVNPETGQIDGYGARHARAILYGISNGEVKATEIIPTVSNPTSIGQVGVTTADSPVFDLQGRKVDAIQHKGVYISNGKKVVR